MFFPIGRISHWEWWIYSFPLTQGKDSLAGSEQWVHEELNVDPFPWKEGITTLDFSVLPCGRHCVKYYSWNIPADSWSATSEFMCKARCIVQPEMKPARQFWGGLLETDRRGHADVWEVLGVILHCFKAGLLWYLYLLLWCLISCKENSSITQLYY